MIRRVVTKYGEIEGLPSADPRITVFKGVPFAQPPVGENRWRAPQPQKPWEGVLKAYAFAPISFQDVPGLGGNIYDNEWNVDPEIPMDEDCLYLNIWTGAKRADEKLPVLVWFFGGGFQWGNTQEMEFDGERLARRGIIVVSVNYRLASLGFLAHPDLTKDQPEGPANFGHLDQKAGLHWVYENIEAFGGDPSKITIAGQSAGGGSVMAQIACKDNFNVLNGAVVFSGMIENPFEPAGFIVPCELKKAEEKGVEFFKYLGVSTVEEARKLSAEFIREKYGEYAREHERMATCIDNVFLEGIPYDMFCKGETANIPIMSGNTSDEFPIALMCKPQELEERAKELFGEKKDEFLSFPEVKNSVPGFYGKFPIVEYSVKSAFIKRAQNPSNKPGYYYCFDPDIPGEDKPGTFHSVDLWFWFESISKASRPFVGRHFDLARKMANYFVAFVKTGDPNTAIDNDGSAQLLWKPYDDNNKNEMVFTSNGPKTILGKDGYVEFLAKHF